MNSVERVKNICKERKIPISKLEKDLGFSNGYIAQLRKGSFPADRLSLIAEYFDVSTEYLLRGENRKAPTTLGEHLDNIMPLPGFTKKPRLGVIACGNPILALEDATEFDDVPDHVHCDFTLKCKGDSMINARIFDGDIVYIRRQDTVDNREIAAVLIDDEATLKRVCLYEDHIILEPENPLFRPLVFWGEEMNAVRILGKAVAFTSAIR